ncbi:VOC family protein [soil metagenome]
MRHGGFVGSTELRSRFAQDLAQLYGSEVPAYNTLVEVSREVNADTLATHGQHAERLGDIDRVTAERHGAIRVGSPEELAQVARVFAAFGMYPVGFYDLRNSDGTGVPVVSTAFRPTDPGELARNPFRVFTSMLAVDDSRFFDEDTRAALARFVGARRIFVPELLELADRATKYGGLDSGHADELLRLATDAFRLSQAPIDQDWYQHLAAISSVAADIGGVSGTHINHLTPRVLDIAVLYTRMQSRGIEMIDAIQGPPGWDGPDVLLRQTSFRALSERRWFRRKDGVDVLGDLRVRFGEVEQRGIALTASGMQIYERAMANVAKDASGLDQSAQQQIARRVWSESFPPTEAELAALGIGWFTQQVAPAKRTPAPVAQRRLTDLVADGFITPQPIVYEDFLPRSAAGIFRSNLSGRGSRDDSQRGARYDAERLAGIMATEVANPQELYRQQRKQSIRQAETLLGCTIIDDLSPA